MWISRRASKSADCVSSLSVSDSGGLEWGQECTFLINSQVMLMHWPGEWYFENHWTTSVLSHLPNEKNHPEEAYFKNSKSWVLCQTFCLITSREGTMIFYFSKLWVISMIKQVWETLYQISMNSLSASVIFPCGTNGWALQYGSNGWELRSSPVTGVWL